jgi:hypothetical protein
MVPALHRLNHLPSAPLSLTMHSQPAVQATGRLPAPLCLKLPPSQPISKTPRLLLFFAGGPDVSTDPTWEELGTVGRGVSIASTTIENNVKGVQLGDPVL